MHARCRFHRLGCPPGRACYSWSLFQRCSLCQVVFSTKIYPTGAGSSICIPELEIYMAKKILLFIGEGKHKRQHLLYALCSFFYKSNPRFSTVVHAWSCTNRILKCTVLVNTDKFARYWIGRRYPSILWRAVTRCLALTTQLELQLWCILWGL